MYTEEQRQDHIRELQEYLRALSATDERYPLLGVDGFYGPETTQAVKVFQEITQSPITGTVKRADWERIVREYNDLLLVTIPPLCISPFSDPAFVLEPGISDPFVNILQVMLNAIGGEAIAITGIYDADTVQRVLQVQQKAEFPLTGKVDRITWDHLAVLYNDRR